MLREALQGQDVNESLGLVFKLALIQEELERPQEAVKAYEEALGYIANPDGTVAEENKRNAGLFLARIAAVYQRLSIGDPRQNGVLVGPLIDQGAFDAMESALAAARKHGGKVHGGGRVTDGVSAGG